MTRQNGKSLEEILHPDDYGSIAEIFCNAAETEGKHIYESRLNKEDESLFWVSGIVEKTRMRMETDPDRHIP